MNLLAIDDFCFLGNSFAGVHGAILSMTLSRLMFFLLVT